MSKITNNQRRLLAHTLGIDWDVEFLKAESNGFADPHYIYTKNK
jgi:hypothetical protein